MTSLPPPAARDEDEPTCVTTPMRTQGDEDDLRGPDAGADGEEEAVAVDEPCSGDDDTAGIRSCATGGGRVVAPPGAVEAGGEPVVGAGELPGVGRFYYRCVGVLTLPLPAAPARALRLPGGQVAASPPPAVISFPPLGPRARASTGVAAPLQAILPGETRRTTPSPPPPPVLPPQPVVISPPVWSTSPPPSIPSTTPVPSPATIPPPPATVLQGPATTPPPAMVGRTPPPLLHGPLPPRGPSLRSCVEPSAASSATPLPPAETGTTGAVGAAVASPLPLTHTTLPPRASRRGRGRGGISKGPFGISRGPFAPATSQQGLQQAPWQPSKAQSPAGGRRTPPPGMMAYRKEDVR